MVSTTSSPTIYLVAIDGSACASHALEVACTLASALAGPAELHIVHAFDVTPGPATMGVGLLAPPPDLLDAGKALLDSACTEAAGRFTGRIAGHLAAGYPWREIVQLASSLRADLIIVGTAGRTGLSRLVLGSVAETVVRHAACPVLVVRPKDYHAATDPAIQPPIEPPCSDCLAVQARTERAELWCERHAAHDPRGHLHYETPPTFGVGSMNFRP